MRNKISWSFILLSREPGEINDFFALMCKIVRYGKSQKTADFTRFAEEDGPFGGAKASGKDDLSYGLPAIQVVQELKRGRVDSGIEVVRGLDYLKTL